MEFGDFILVELQGRACLEQHAVEAFEGGIQCGSKAALVHDQPQAFQRGHEILRRLFHLFEKFLEAFFWHEAHIFGEHGEKAAHEEFGHVFRVVALFEGLGDFGEAGGDVARDLGGFAGGV